MITIQNLKKLLVLTPFLLAQTIISMDLFNPDPAHPQYPLFQAIQNDTLTEQMLEYFIESGINIDAPLSGIQGSPLTTAAELGNDRIANLLLDHNADIHAQNDYALKRAVIHGKFTTVALLLERDANILRSDEHNGNTVLHEMLENGRHVGNMTAPEQLRMMQLLLTWSAQHRTFFSQENIQYLIDRIPNFFYSTRQPAIDRQLRELLRNYLFYIQIGQLMNDFLVETPGMFSFLEMSAPSVFISSSNPSIPITNHNNAAWHRSLESSRLIVEQAPTEPTHGPVPQQQNSIKPTEIAVFAILSPQEARDIPQDPNPEDFNGKYKLFATETVAQLPATESRHSNAFSYLKDPFRQGWLLQLPSRKNYSDYILQLLCDQAFQEYLHNQNIPELTPHEDVFRNELKTYISEVLGWEEDLPLRPRLTLEQLPDSDPIMFTEFTVSREIAILIVALVLKKNPAIALSILDTIGASHENVIANTEHSLYDLSVLMPALEEQLRCV